MALFLSPKAIALTALFMMEPPEAACQRIGEYEESSPLLSASVIEH
jgi:hypothetical protein